MRPLSFLHSSFGGYRAAWIVMFPGKISRPLSGHGEPSPGQSPGFSLAANMSFDGCFPGFPVSFQPVLNCEPTGFLENQSP